jgi:hypothetical protein
LDFSGSIFGAIEEEGRSAGVWRALKEFLVGGVGGFRRGLQGCLPGLMLAPTRDWDESVFGFVGVFRGGFGRII